MPNQIPWWLSPVLSTALALVVAWIAIYFDRRKSLNQELIRKRIAIYDDMAPRLNDLLCFVRTIGRWKNLEPPAMVDSKRDLDRSFYLYGPLFSGRLSTRYHAFIDSVFAIYQGYGTAAKLRAPLARLKAEWGNSWDPAWDAFFADPTDETAPGEVDKNYAALMDQFAVEIGAPRRRRAA